MARRKKGRDVHGWIVVDKPAGPTSTAVVNKVKWAFNANKAGHAGTLDPEATGVLAIALGEATKTIPYISDALKAYRFSVRFGQATNTDDAEGTVIHQSDARPSDAAILEALKPFRGDIMQVPPKFSAVKVDGQRAYKLAREDDDFELSARPLYVDEIELFDRPDADHCVIDMVCGKGGYVRSIARDLGEALGCYGHVEWLRRTWSGPWDAEDGVTLATVDELARTEALDDLLRPVDEGLGDLPELRATADGAVKLRNGNPGQVFPGDAEYGDEVWVSDNGQPVAIGVFRSGEVHPSRVFNL
ncbi:tRNA pseudouridine(55) synthase TruB [Celeribacter arenosi]|uniref:tRNA pseudouridine synthase B n=1 Tax=Celeribacter arenosi TaxID=792649 RepID=A0ABP7JWH6_9RHOB